MSEAYSEDASEAWHGQGDSFEDEIFGENDERRLAAVDFGETVNRIVRAIPETHEYSMLGIPGQGHKSAVRLLRCGFDTAVRFSHSAEDDTITSRFMNVSFERKIGNVDKRTMVLIHEHSQVLGLDESNTDIIAILTVNNESVRQAKWYNGDSSERALGAIETAAAESFLRALYLDMA